MHTAITVIHLTACVVLIFVVLIQSSKGAQMGAAFGGSSQTVFGTRGAATFLSKMTTVMAILFMFTSLFLAISGGTSTSVVSPSGLSTGGGAPMKKSPIDSKGFDVKGSFGAINASTTSAVNDVTPTQPNESTNESIDEDAGSVNSTSSQPVDSEINNNSAANDNASANIKQ
ncbi:MAG: preprotein translocase subunit SecG [Candidatus Magnetoovum sp. WYHC-5]|nr:preprotein translocase subunit SecG [Candidatus Magnetoovum sp. WYHC-5]